MKKPKQKDYIKDGKFLKSAFGRDMLPYMWGIRNGDRKGEIVKIDIGVIRKPMPWADQQRCLTSPSIAIMSHCSLHHSKMKYHFCKKVKGICTPFNEMAGSWKKRAPHIELCESDMVDKSWIYTKNIKDKKKKTKFRKKYDIFMLTEFNKKGFRNKGLQILYFLLDIERELGLKVCILDTATKSCWISDQRNSIAFGSYLREITKISKQRADGSDIIRPRHGRHKDFLTQSKMNGLMQSSRCVLSANTDDASPKIITEALIRGIPVVLNKNILGGCKYINETTGALFDGGKSVEDVVENYDAIKKSLFSALTKVLSKEDRPQDIIKYYHKNWGLKNTSARLAGFVNKVFKKDYSYVFYPQFKKYFRRK